VPFDAWKVLSDLSSMAMAKVSLLLTLCNEDLFPSFGECFGEWAGVEFATASPVPPLTSQPYASTASG
jgi:hypothetical protein